MPRTTALAGSFRRFSGGIALNKARVFAQQKYETSLKSFRKAVARFEYPEMIAQYSHLYQQGRIAELEAEDHTSMLISLANHRVPRDASKPAEKVINNMVEHGIVLDMRDHHTILTIYLRAQEFGRMESHFDSMRNYFNITPDVRCFNLMLAAYSMQNNHEKVMATWQACNNTWPASKYLNMDGWAFLIDSYGTVGNLSMCEQIFQRLQQRLEGSQVQISPSIHEARIRAAGYCQNLSIASEIFESQVSAGLNLDQNFGLFDAMIDAAARCDEPGRMDALLQKLLDHCSQIDSKIGMPQRTLRINLTWNGPQDSILADYTSPYPSTLARLMDFYYMKRKFDKVCWIWCYFEPCSRFSQKEHELAAYSFLRIGENETAKKILYHMPARGLTVPKELRKKLLQTQSGTVEMLN
jgi:hypothetical protein